MGYGRWLAEEAGRASLPVVETRPQDTLHKRMLAALNPYGGIAGIAVGVSQTDG